MCGRIVAATNTVTRFEGPTRIPAAVEGLSFALQALGGPEHVPLGHHLDASALLAPSSDSAGRKRQRSEDQGRSKRSTADRPKRLETWWSIVRHDALPPLVAGVPRAAIGGDIRPDTGDAFWSDSETSSMQGSFAHFSSAYAFRSRDARAPSPPPPPPPPPTAGERLRAALAPLPAKTAAEPETDLVPRGWSREYIRNARLSAMSADSHGEYTPREYALAWTFEE